MPEKLTSRNGTNAVQNERTDNSYINLTLALPTSSPEKFRHSVPKRVKHKCRQKQLAVSHTAQDTLQRASVCQRAVFKPESLYPHPPFLSPVAVCVHAQNRVPLCLKNKNRNDPGLLRILTSKEANQRKLHQAAKKIAVPAGGRRGGDGVGVGVPLV